MQEAAVLKTENDAKIKCELPLKALLLLLGSLLSQARAAHAMEPLPCPETRFLVPGTDQNFPPHGGSVLLTDFARLRGFERACTEPRIRVRRLASGFRFHGRWADCPLYFQWGPVFFGIATPRPAALRFVGFVPSDCSRLDAHFRARWYDDSPLVVRDFTAPVSRCGDGIVDDAAGEQCEPVPGTPPCLSDCRFNLDGAPPGQNILGTP